ncbi:hypothetical protein KL929_003843 [Ogataea haglerorum]|uniref:uncharacterized protein n=1 Tax=Ogataea haglerorum TaxID=1937702 RepID=UPI001C89FE27|nr:uncharacterized protein KL911_001499 [Ogataea haglerorum]KAG7693241.1 hypothetical protein KL915_004140 [Ogataea haglerorum]KAG7694354.1 hypothetical protein KL951_004232 [Ogataea haglerorum]KAG7722898.1 hypothetical protein KL913_000718 [Ogataea haglerorum]KAG7723003.1 hypothetical protein KL949_000053 [Ogataea haglerorum]KAG7745018.1 hypothetical protein KL932_000048 [Ogataea haglerorum]
MRLLFWLAIFTATAFAAWSAEDLEIFKLQHELVKDTKKETNFYEYLGLSNGPKASYDEINRAYKKMSRKLHPDKVRRKEGMSQKAFERRKKAAEQRFQRLSLIGSILRGERKERYDYYLKNGFPAYTGTGFALSKFRPGPVLALVVVVVLFSAVHYIMLKLNTQQKRKRVERLINDLKTKAYGPSMLPGTNFSDQRVAHMDKLFVVKFDGSVWLVDKELKEGEDYVVDEDGRQVFRVEAEPKNRKQRRAKKDKDEVLLRVTPDDVEEVTWRHALVVKLVFWAVSKLKRKLKTENKADKGTVKRLPNGKVKKVKGTGENGEKIK